MIKSLLLAFAVFFVCLPGVHGQFSGLTELIAKNDTLNLHYGREKIFIHNDRQQYQLNDTVWFRGYIVDAPYHQVKDASKIAYIELIDDKGEVIKRIITPTIFGVFYNSLHLNEDLFSQGNYTLRAYTNYMRNFGDSLFFENSIKIIDPKARQWGISFSDLSFSKNRLSVAAALNSGQSNSLADQKLQVRFKSKNKILFNTRMQTDALGNFYIDTAIKKEYRPDDLVLEIFEGKNLMLQAPVKDEEKQPIDLQFLPEGGNLVAGKKQRLGIKALDVYGNGIDVKGTIRDGKNNNVANFSTIYRGMGIVWLQAANDEQYTAYLDDGSTYKLPPVAASGTTLGVFYNKAGDSVIVEVDASPDLHSQSFYISGTTRGISYVKGVFSLKGQPYRLKIERAALPDGISKFTIFNGQALPLNERAVFNRNNDTLSLSFSANKPEYKNKDSVGIRLTAKDISGAAVAGSFSVAVVDTGQIQIPHNMQNIISYMLLGSDLRGNIETPAIYINHPASDTTDALILTQGWVNYRFSDLAKRNYLIENQFAISGKVTNISNKPVPNSRVTLFAKDGTRSVFLDDTLTNSNGNFVFKNFPIFSTDSVKAVIKALNKRNKAFGIGVEVDEKNYPPFEAGATSFESRNILFDTVSKKFVDRRSLVLEQMRRDGRMLEEVIVTAKAKIPGSKNLNEDGGADQTIPLSVLENMPKKTLFDVLTEKVPGFRQGTLPRSTELIYMVNSNIARFIFDGVDINFFYEARGPGSNDYILFANQYLQYYTAEDIKGIEVMNTPRYNGAYRSTYLSIGEIMNSGPATRDYSFIEITTHGGVGPFMKKIPGMYLLKLNAPFAAKTFYSPRYSSPDEETVFPDLRSTVYWNPNVMTDSTGNAEFSFFTTESKSSYIIMLQGTDFHGRFGVKYHPVFVKPED